MMKKVIYVFFVLSSILVVVCNTVYAEITGAGWFIVECTLGTECTIYVPANSSEFWGIDEDGYLVNCGSSTVSGYILSPQGTTYPWRCSSLSTSEYRVSSNNYTWTSLPCRVVSTT